MARSSYAHRPSRLIERVGRGRTPAWLGPGEGPDVLLTLVAESDHRPGQPSQLVAQVSQEAVSLDDVGVGLDAERSSSVDHTDDAAAALGGGDEHVDLIGGGAEDGAHLRDRL